MFAIAYTNIDNIDRFSGRRTQVLLPTFLLLTKMTNDTYTKIQHLVTKSAFLEYIGLCDEYEKLRVYDYLIAK